MVPGVELWNILDKCPLGVFSPLPFVEDSEGVKGAPTALQFLLNSQRWRKLILHAVFLMLTLLIFPFLLPFQGCLVLVFKFNLKEQRKNGICWVQAFLDLHGAGGLPHILLLMREAPQVQWTKSGNV